MGVFEQGGGGGRAPNFTANDNYALDKPYDVNGTPTPEKMQQIDEMLRILFKSATRAAADTTTVNTTLSSGTGNVTGPASAISGHVATFNGITGKIIQDGGVAVTSLGGSWQEIEVNLTNAQIASLGTSPVDFLAAQGAGTVIIPYAGVMEKLGTLAYGNSPLIDIQYSHTDFNGFNLLSEFTSDLNNARASINVGLISNQRVFTDYATRDPRNKGLRVRTATGANPTGAGTATIRFNIKYWVFSTQ